MRQLVRMRNYLRRKRNKLTKILISYGNALRINFIRGIFFLPERFELVLSGRIFLEIKKNINNLSF